MAQFHYVYRLQSIPHPIQIYIGQTADLSQHLAEHNSGKVTHTSKFGPWEIKNAVAFREKEKAVAFERYLKSGSGRAFAKRHF